MNTEQELRKAHELALKFTCSTDVVKPNKRSVEMALICVNEILESNPSAPVKSKQGSYYEDIIQSIEYWIEVKQILENYEIINS